MSNPSALYVYAESKGRFLFDSLQRRINDPDALDIVEANIEIHYTVDRWEEAGGFGTKALAGALRNENIDNDNWTQLFVKSNGYTDWAYINYISATQGSIVCADNDKMHDHNAPGNRLQWSEIMFQLYQIEGAKQLQELRKIQTIWRFWIVNQNTRAILDEAKSCSSSDDKGSFIEYRPGAATTNSGFFAILGSPNGSGVVRMLLDHCKALRKTIECIRVLKESKRMEPPILYFVLTDATITTTAPAKGSKRSAAGQKRDARRQKRDDPGRSQGSQLLESA